MGEEEKQETLRHGVPVEKVTIEFEKDLYQKMQDYMSLNGETLRDFITDAVCRNLEKTLPPKDRPEIYKVYMRRHIKVREFYNALCEYTGENIALALMLAKCDDAGIDYHHIRNEDLEKLKSGVLKALGCVFGENKMQEIDKGLSDIIRTP